MATITVLGTRRRHGRGRRRVKKTLAVTKCTRLAQPHEINRPVATTTAPVTSSPEPAPAAAPVKADLTLAIEKLNLSIRPYNVLKREGINTVGDLVGCTEQHLLVNVRGLGRKFVDEIKDKLRSRDLALKAPAHTHQAAA